MRDDDAVRRSFIEIAVRWAVGHNTGDTSGQRFWQGDCVCAHGEGTCGNYLQLHA
jgi:hypothetical protein